MPFFHSHLLDLTGDAASTRDVTRLYRVYYAKVAIEGAAEHTIDHSRFHLADGSGLASISDSSRRAPLSDRMIAVIQSSFFQTLNVIPCNLVSTLGCAQSHFRTWARF